MSGDRFDTKQRMDLLVTGGIYFSTDRQETINRKHMAKFTSGDRHYVKIATDEFSLQGWLFTQGC